MKCVICLFLMSIMVEACSPTKNTEKNARQTDPGSTSSSPSYGYTPVDPLPAYIDSISNSKSKYTQNYLLNIAGDDPLAGLFPDETIRIAIANVSASGNITFLTSSVGAKDSTYVIILDYIKYATLPLVASLGKDDNGNTIIRSGFLYGSNSPFTKDSIVTGKAIIPLYVGFGLRITATVKCLSAQVSLGNLFGIAASASANQVSGTLVVQTLGITGNDISPLIPMPSDLNSTTIQNAILSLGSIKAKFYEHSTILSPRVIGFYNTIGGKNNISNSVIANVFSRPIAVPSSYSDNDVSSDAFSGPVNIMQVQKPDTTTKMKSTPKSSKK
jgi:hypothetical protein